MTFSPRLLGTAFGLLIATSVYAAPATPSKIVGTWSRLDAEITVSKAADGYAVAGIEGTCGDRIAGTATLAGNVLTLKTKQDAKTCTVTITFAGGDAILADTCAIPDSTCSMEGTYLWVD